MVKQERYFLYIILTLVVLGGFCYGMFRLSSEDYSARQNEHRRKLGAVYMTLNNPFYEIIDEEIRTAVENHGDILITRDTALSVERQAEEIKELVDRGVELLFVNPVDWEQIEPAIESAYLARIPVIAIDTNVQDDRYVMSTVVSDNYMAGQQCASHLVSHADGGSIALLKHSEARSSVDRMQGFCDAIAQHGSFRIVDEEECLGQLELAMPAMERMLERHPEIDIVMSLNDPAAMGAMAAFRMAGRLDDVMIYGVDGVPETKEMIAEGHMTATAGQSPRKIGQRAVEQAYRILEGEKPTRLIKLPTKLWSMENISDSNIEGWD